MKAAELSRERLKSIVAGFAKARIAVVGDFFLDKYLDVDPALAERSLETGKIANQVVGVRCSPGAAGTVVCNLAALRAGKIISVGIIGEDGEGFDLRRKLTALGCDMEHLIVSPQRRTPTYLKPGDAGAGLAGEHSRYDTKNRTPTPGPLIEKIISSLSRLSRQVDAIILMDQVEEADCGVITPAVRQSAGEFARRDPQTIYWADSRAHIRLFRHVIIKPNQFEAAGVSNPRPHQIVELGELMAAGTSLRTEIGAPVVITRGAGGMLVSDPEWTAAAGVAVEGPIDPTGAGDSATAGAVLSLCAGATLPEAAVVGNLVASITIQQLGTTGTATAEQLIARHSHW